MNTGTCHRCGEPIESRVSAKGRRYDVNGEGATGPRGQIHSRYCTARRAAVTPSPVSPVTASSHPAIASDSLADTIAAAIASRLPSSASLDEARVREIVAEARAFNVTVSVRGSDAEPVAVGRQHAKFALLLSVMARRINVYMVGPAGSGKTSAAHSASTALSLAFGGMSVGPQTTQSAIFGYMDAHGNYVATEFRRRYESGGVFLMDEIDRGNPGVLTAMNQAIENGTCAFPDGMIARHPDFILVAAANTYGTGASREYVGAMQLDAATLNRFAFIAWEYDEALESDIARATFAAAGGTDARVLDAWVSKVRHARERANALKIRHIVSPRASIRGADMLASGIAESDVATMLLWQGLDADTRARLEGGH